MHITALLLSRCRHGNIGGKRGLAISHQMPEPLKSSEGGSLAPREEVKDLELDGRVSECHHEGCDPAPQHGSH